MTLAQACVSSAVGTLNAGGRALARVGLTIPALTSEALMSAARRRTGLEHFGDWQFEEPLERLLVAYERRAELTMLGRLTVRELIVSLLENLLRLEAERKRDARVEQQSVVRPLFIVGLPRTGTTLLHNLTGEDPGNRVPRTWEVMFPAYEDSANGRAAARSRAGRRLAIANRLAPEFKRIHAIAPDLPQECIAITAQVFRSIQFHTTHDVAEYQDWLEHDDQRLAYAFHCQLLKHLQAKSPGGRWVLKAPGHLFALQALIERYPDAYIVQTHRDPLRVMASMASHATVLRRAFSRRADPRAIAGDWAARWARALERFLAVRDRSPSARFLDVAYEDIEAAPMETVERIYDFAGWQLTEAARRAMRAFLAANPKDKHGAHRYSLAEYGLERRIELARFSRYCERFNVQIASD
jgi:hypothetical protein